MAEIITTLHKKGDSTIDVYPNIKASNIPNNAITASKINTGAVTNPKIADSSIGESKIIDGSVTSAKIYTGAVTTNKLSNNAVTTAKLDDASVTTAKLNNGAVTIDKIADASINNNKLTNLLYNAIYEYTHSILLRVDTPSNYINVNFIFKNNVSTKYTTFADIIDALKDIYHVGDPIIANGLCRDSFYIFQVELLNDNDKLDLIGNYLNGNGSTAEVLNESDITDIVDQII